MRYAILLILLLASSANAVTHSPTEIEYLEEKHQQEQQPHWIHATPLQAEMVQYAWKHTNSFDFVLTVTQESAWNYNAEWDYRNGVPTSYWLCQRHGEPEWRNKYDDPIVGDWKKQIETCRETWQYRKWLWTLQTWLYAYDIRHTREDEFIRK